MVEVTRVGASTPNGGDVRACVLLAMLLWGCGGGPRAAVSDAIAREDVSQALEAYNSFRAVDGADGELLAGVAALVLELEALGDDEIRRDAALSQLRIAGTAGSPVLERLASSEGITMVRAVALQTLARRGDGGAEAFLYAMLDEDDPAILAVALTSVDAQEETERLLALLRDTHPAVRRAAALQLATATESIEAMHALAQSARVDPEARVRNAAVRALGSFGAAAMSTLRERLGDSDATVRLAVVRALVRADRGPAIRIIAPLLATPPSRAGIEAARVIALTGETREDSETDGEIQRGLADARRYLLGALNAEDHTLRSQAAVALVSLRSNDATDAALLGALSREEDPGVRLGIARALRGQDIGGDHAVSALTTLMEGEGMPAVQAAVLLAPDGREDALVRLEAAIASGDSLLRQVAARALAKDAQRPDEVRGLLRDDDPRVRIHAAGGILAASNS